jgi:Ethanolamine utilisation protein EutA
MGGGTTKLAIVERGRVLATAALHIGGRLQVTDEQVGSPGSTRQACPGTGRTALCDGG